MDKNKLVITIERQYGSGGRIVGKRLAEELGVSYYDDEILSMTAEKSAVGEQYFRLADEKAGNNVLRKIVGGMGRKLALGHPKIDGDVTSPENLFRFQSEVIRELADQNTTMIIVTHEMAFARDVADHVIFMDDGRIVEQGDPRQVFENPSEERTKQFLSRFHEG